MDCANWGAMDWAAFAGAITAIVGAVVGGAVAIINAIKGVKTEVRTVQTQNAEQKQVLDALSAQP